METTQTLSPRDAAFLGDRSIFIECHYCDGHGFTGSTDDDLAECSCFDGAYRCDSCDDAPAVTTDIEWLPVLGRAGKCLVCADCAAAAVGAVSQ